MKYLLTLGALSCMLILGSAQTYSHPDVEAGFDVFYNSLSPYGEWVNVDFGHAWRPLNVGYGWRPYLHGRWEWTDYGWYWASDEPFGWATFHYGRWTYDDYYGWVWLPDDVWGPAWVEWRYNDDYVGWAPLTPYARFGVGITIGGGWVTPVHYWNFVPCRSFAAVHVNEYVQPIERTRRIYGSTRGSIMIQRDGDRVVNRGIDVNFVERRGNLRVNRAEIVGSEERLGEHSSREAGHERIEVYRPRVTGESRTGTEGRSNGNVRTAPAPTGNGRVMDRHTGITPAPTDNRSNGRVQQKTPDRGVRVQPRVDYRRYENRQPTAAPRQHVQPPQQRSNAPARINREAPRGRQAEPAPRKTEKPGGRGH